MQMIKEIQNYKVETLGILFEGKPTTSSQAHEKLINRMEGTHPSRASVINFLQSLFVHNHVSYETQTCKGGYRRVYTLKGNVDDFTNRLELQLNKQFREEYLDPIEAIS